MNRKFNFEERKKISKNDLLTASKNGVISADQVEELWDNLIVSSSIETSSAMLRFFYYFGTILVISAMTWFMTLSWNRFGGGIFFLIALSYGIVFFISGYLLWKKEDFKIPSGLLTTIAVCMTPLAIFGLERYLGIWPTGDPEGYYTSVASNWLFMEIGTIVTGLLVLRYVRFPFITAPIAISFWFLAMDITPFLFGKIDFPWEQECWVSLFFGWGLLVFSYFIDRKKSLRDFAFWGYLFGTLTFWGGLSLLTWTSEIGWSFYFCINMTLILSSIFLKQNSLMIFGALGIFEFLVHLVYEIFKNSIIFFFALSFIGILMIFLGILYQKNAVIVKSLILRLSSKWRTKIFPKNP